MNDHQEQCAAENSWPRRLEQWKASGKSGRAWAREHKIPYHVFCYWRRKLRPNEVTSTAKFFVELADTQDVDSGLTLERLGVVIRVSCDFDSLTLKRCLQILREL